MVTSSVALSGKLPGIEQSIFSVMTALANEHQAINLAQGFPDFTCSPELVSLVDKYMKAGHNQYAPMPGILSLREKIAVKTEKLYGMKYDPQTEITITAGATQALYIAISTVVKEKDEVIILEPAYDSYLPAILLNKGAPKYVRLESPDFEIDWENVKKLVSSKTRLIIINSPHNPTGRVFTDADMRQLQKLVADKDIVVISDEVYEHIVFDGQQHNSLCKYPDLARQSIIVSSFGKTYHTTGWKTGYVMAPKEISAEFRKIYSYAMFSTITPFQFAYSDILDQPELYLSLSEFYQKKRDLFRSCIENSPFKLLACEGTYFQCVDYSDYSDETDLALAERITKEYGVASIPTSAFFHDKFDQKVIRFCFAKNDETLKRAGDKLCKISK
ncbi:MAG: methionine aminotransferase [Bacteroidota bacterium]|nr:methionine aminotransferase [Bacteroidota bacterium]